MGQHKRRKSRIEISVEDMVRYSRNLFNESAAVGQVHIMCFALHSNTIDVLSFTREQADDYIRNLFQSALEGNFCPAAYLLSYAQHAQCQLFPWVWATQPRAEAERLQRFAAEVFGDFLTEHTCTADCHHDPVPQYVN